MVIPGLRIITYLLSIRSLPVYILQFWKLSTAKNKSYRATTFGLWRFFRLYLFYVFTSNLVSLLPFFMLPTSYFVSSRRLKPLRAFYAIPRARNNSRIPLFPPSRARITPRIPIFPPSRGRNYPSILIFLLSGPGKGDPTLLLTEIMRALVQ